MKYQNKSYRNIGILTLVFAFLALGFVGDVGSAQTKKNAKATPTPKSKSKTAQATKKPTPTPSKSKSKSSQKTTAKTKPTPTPKKNTKSKTATAKNDKNSKTKTLPNNKTTSKSSKVTDKKSTTNKKPQTASTKTINKNTKTTTQKTRTQTPVKQTKTTTNVQPNKELPQIVVSSVSTSVRSAPNLTASEVSRARLGSTLKVVEKNAGWYKVQTSNRGTGSVGWIPTAAATSLGTNGANDEIYRQILTKNYKSERMSFAEATEVYDFLTRVQPEIKSESAAAEFGLIRLMALRAALDAIPFEQKEQKIYQDFVRAQDQNIVYSEPSGKWYVRAPLFWDLHSKYTNIPAGEKIAWEASKTPLPGECEGYVNCYLFLLRMTDGEYLNFYPNGANANEALTDIIRLLEPIAADANTKTIYNGATDSSDLAEFHSLITELRVIVSRLPNTEKEKALQQLKKIAEGFK